MKKKRLTTWSSIGSWLSGARMAPAADGRCEGGTLRWGGAFGPETSTDNITARGVHGEWHRRARRSAGRSGPRTRGGGRRRRRHCCRYCCLCVESQKTWPPSHYPFVDFTGSSFGQRVRLLINWRDSMADCGFSFFSDFREWSVRLRTWPIGFIVFNCLVSIEQRFKVISGGARGTLSILLPGVFVVVKAMHVGSFINHSFTFVVFSLSLSLSLSLLAIFAVFSLRFCTGESRK